MKQVFFAFIFIPFLASGQVTRDTILTVDTLVFREVTIVEGTTTTTTKTLIGESQSQAIAYLLEQVTPAADRYARQAVTFARRDAIKPVQQPINLLLQQYTGTGYTGNAGTVLGDAVLGTYRYRKNGASDLTTTIIRIANGGIRFRHSSTNYTVRVISKNWITVLAFDSTPEINLFWDGDRGEWVSIDLVYNLKRQ